MSVDRLTRVNALLRREIAESLFHVLRDSEVDFAAVTVTEVTASRNLRFARVLVSIRADAAGQEKMLSALRRHRVAIQALINRDLKLKFTPKLDFELDKSIERGDRVLALIHEIEGETGETGELEPETFEVAEPPPDDAADDEDPEEDAP